MKKIGIALLMLIFSFSIAEARPMGRHHNRHNNSSKHVVIKKKSSRTDKFAVGLLAGITGVIIGDRIFNGSSYNYNTHYYQPTPAPAANCVTTVSRYDGTTTTTCRAQPQYNSVIYIN